MEITGKITHILETRSGQSSRTGNNWTVQSFVIEAIEPGRQFPSRCMFEVFGEDRLRQFNIQAGEVLTVSLDIDAREYNGRWFNSLRAWKVERPQIDPATGMPIVPAVGAATVAPAATAAATAAPVATAIPAPQTIPGAEGVDAADSTDGLPF